jgi:hypothetical protein
MGKGPQDWKLHAHLISRGMFATWLKNAAPADFERMIAARDSSQSNPSRSGVAETSTRVRSEPSQELVYARATARYTSPTWLLDACDDYALRELFYEKAIGDAGEIQRKAKVAAGRRAVNDADFDARYALIFDAVVDAITAIDARGVISEEQFAILTLPVLPRSAAG